MMSEKPVPVGAAGSVKYTQAHKPAISPQAWREQATPLLFFMGVVDGAVFQRRLSCVWLLARAYFLAQDPPTAIRLNS